MSAADGTSPLLIAAINGHFDLAMRFLEMGADPTLASGAGATPLYGALNMQWAPKARHPQPTDYLQQSVTYLEVMDAMLAAGADVDARLTKSLWYTTYNRDLLGVDRAGATPFWAGGIRARHQRHASVAGPRHRPPSSDPHLCPAAGAPSTPTPRVCHRWSWVDPRCRRCSPHRVSGTARATRGNTHRHVPDSWFSAVRVPGRRGGRRRALSRFTSGYNAIHHAAARGDNELVLYLVEQGVDVTQVSRRGQTTVDMANGPVQRIQPFPETIALLERLGAKNNHRCLSC